MSNLIPTGMDATTGQFKIAANGDTMGIGSISMSQTIFTSTADATITNTTSETSGLGTGTGTKTILANTLIAGRTIRIEGGGVYSAAVIAPGNVTIKVKLGSTVIGQTTLSAILSGAATLGFQFETDLIFRTIGATGTVIISGSMDYATSAAGARLYGDLTNNGSAVTIDTTVDQIIDVSVTWQTASVSNIIKVNASTIEQLW